MCVCSALHQVVYKEGGVAQVKLMCGWTEEVRKTEKERVVEG